METRTPRLKKKYSDEVAASLQEKFNYKSSMQLPKLLKISINQGVGKATQDKKMIDVAIDEMTRITVRNVLLPYRKKIFRISNYVLPNQSV